MSDTKQPNDIKVYRHEKGHLVAKWRDPYSHVPQVACIPAMVSDEIWSVLSSERIESEGGNASNEP